MAPSCMFSFADKTLSYLLGSELSRLNSILCIQKISCSQRVYEYLFLRYAYHYIYTQTFTPIHKHIHNLDKNPHEYECLKHTHTYTHTYARVHNLDKNTFEYEYLKYAHTHTNAHTHICI